MKLVILNDGIKYKYVTKGAYEEILSNRYLFERFQVKNKDINGLIYSAYYLNK